MTRREDEASRGTRTKRGPWCRVCACEERRRKALTSLEANSVKPSGKQRSAELQREGTEGAHFTAAAIRKGHTQERWLHATCEGGGGARGVWLSELRYHNCSHAEKDEQPRKNSEDGALHIGREQRRKCTVSERRPRKCGRERRPVLSLAEGETEGTPTRARRLGVEKKDVVWATLTSTAS